MKTAEASALSYTIEPQADADLPAVEVILDLAFGPDRHQKTAYRLRDNVEPVPELSLVARQDGKVFGTLRFWPILIRRQGAADVPALMLGPIAVLPDLKGRGIGISLMREGLARAKVLGHRIVILVGDYPYYNRVGFEHIEHGRFLMPGWVDLDRLLALELVPGALEGVSGRIVSLA